MRPNPRVTRLTGSQRDYSALHRVLEVGVMPGVGDKVQFDSQGPH